MMKVLRPFVFHKSFLLSPFKNDLINILQILNNISYQIHFNFNIDKKNSKFKTSNTS
jgi:hypothetical protein